MFTIQSRRSSSSELVLIDPATFISVMELTNKAFTAQCFDNKAYLFAGFCATYDEDADVL